MVKQRIENEKMKNDLCKHNEQLCTSIQQFNQTHLCHMASRAFVNAGNKRTQIWRLFTYNLRVDFMNAQQMAYVLILVVSVEHKDKDIHYYCFQLNMSSVLFIFLFQRYNQFKEAREKSFNSPASIPYNEQCTYMFYCVIASKYIAQTNFICSRFKNGTV